VTGTQFTMRLLNALQATRSALIAFLLIAAAWLIVAGYTSINAVVKAELFPTKVRATGVGLPPHHQRDDGKQSPDQPAPRLELFGAE
jgi:MFS transporter, MHS family, alpha-ketoglutarate permease